MSKRAILYARVSGDDRGTEGRNLAGQLEMCRAYAQAHSYSIVAELAEDDRGASGAAFELPQLNRIRELAQAGAFDVLVVRELDRLSRSLAKQLFVEEELKRVRVAIEYVLGEYPDTPEGGLLKNVRAVIAEYERLKIVERMTRGKRRAVAAGSVLAYGRPPFGYRLIRDGALYRLEVNEAEAAIVRLIFHLYTRPDRPLNGQQIAAELTQRGIPTAAELGHTPAVVKRTNGWPAVSVNAMLRNETYAGTWHYRKYDYSPPGPEQRTIRPRAEWLAVAVPPIVDSATWQAAVVRRRVNRDAALRNTAPGHAYLLRRRVLCGGCGARMRGATNTEAPQRSYYRCPAHERHYARSCGNRRSFRRQPVEDAVWGWLYARLTQPALLAAGLAELAARRAAQVQPLELELAYVDQQLASLAAQGERLLDIYLAGALPVAKYTARAAALAAQQAPLTARRSELLLAREAAQGAPMIAADVQTVAGELATALAEAGDDFAFRRYVIERLDVQVVLYEAACRQQWSLTCLLGAGAGVL